MSTLTDTATAITTAIDVPQTSPPMTKRYNGRSTEKTANSSTQRIRETKYRHVFATHSEAQSSCLSPDADEHPSFVGFRNLMVLVLGTTHSPVRLAGTALTRQQLCPTCD
jgi:diacylglycerol O-acyltransferase-1